LADRTSIINDNLGISGYVHKAPLGITQA